MRKEKKWIYYCEFCKKSGRSAPHIKWHEAHCTMNPNRECGMCALIDLDQAPLPELLGILPEPVWKENEYGKSFLVDDAFNTAFVELRKRVENCPACIMAALRQRGIPVSAIEDFRFSDECKAWMEEFYSSQYESYSFGSMW